MIAPSFPRSAAEQRRQAGPMKPLRSDRHIRSAQTFGNFHAIFFDFVSPLKGRLALLQPVGNTHCC